MSVMTLIPRLEEHMFKQHMKKYQAAVNGIRQGFKLAFNLALA